VAEPHPSSSDRRRRSARHRRVLLAAVLSATGLTVWYGTSCSRTNLASAGADPAVRSTLHLETFVLNLADTDQKAYLRVGIDLGLSEEIKPGQPLPVAAVRDTILGVLGEAKVDDLATAAGKEKLKQDLLHALQNRVPQIGVQEIYFTEFLIQR
jgi:flagellar basal body-associated protein FliL